MKLNKVRVHVSDIIPKEARVLCIMDNKIFVPDGPDHGFVWIHPDDEHLIVRNGMTRYSKVFKVIGVSRNTNSFGLYGHMLMAKDGEAWSAGASIHNKKKTGDLVHLFYTKPDGNEFDWAGQFEIPERLPDCPKDLINSFWDEQEAS